MASDNERRVEPVCQKARFGHIYLIENGPYYKIGKSSQGSGRPEEIAKRINTHEPRLPHKAVFIALWQCWVWNMDSLEIYLHRQFQRERVNGEWFVLSAYQIRWLYEQQDLPMWESRFLWEPIERFAIDLPTVIPCPS
jgi:hypothetical protein